MPEPDLYARPLGPDGKPTGPMRQLGRLDQITWEPWNLPDVRDAFPGLRPARFTSEYTFTVQPGDEARVMSLFHGGPTWLWETRLAWVRCGTRPLSRGTAWRDGALAACVHQLTGPPEPPPRPRFPRTPVYPQWFLDLLVLQMRRAHGEHPELFDPRAWTTGDWPTDLTASQLAEQHPGARRIYDRNWHIATDPGAAVHAPPRTVARDYPPPAEPCDACVAATEPWWDQIVAARANRPPRTDFMPHYPR